MELFLYRQAAKAKQQQQQLFLIYGPYLNCVCGGAGGLDLLLSLVNSMPVSKLILQQYARTNRLVQIYALETLVSDSQQVVELPVSLSAQVVGLQSANN